MGNKTKYSKAVVDRICKLIADGLNYKQACQAAGICETSLLVWRKRHPDFAEKIEAAREIMRAAVLAKIKAGGATDWRAHVEFLRLAFAEYRFSSQNQVNVAISQSMHVSDPERAELIEKLEETRARALAVKNVATEPLQLEDKHDARETALETERHLGEPPTPEPEPERLKERPPRNIVERDEWRAAANRQAAGDEVDEILDF
jgi:hypothetical protein